MARVRFTFLPVFFVSLTIVFIIALAIRLHSEGAEPAPPAVVPQTTAEPDRPVVQPAPLRPRESTALPSAESAPLTEQQPHTTTIAASQESGLLEAVWFDPRSIRTGQATPLHLRLAKTADAKHIQGSLMSAGRTSRLPLTCSAGADSVWTCSVAVSACIACGRWSIEHLSVETSSGSVIDVPGTAAALARATLQVWGERCDSDPPVVHAVASADDDLVFTVSDNGCGVATVKATLASATGQTAVVTAAPSGDEDTWTAHAIQSRATMRGIWHLRSVEVADSAGNARTYAESDPLFKDVAIRIDR